MRLYFQKILTAVFLTACSLALAACAAGFYLLTTASGGPVAVQFFLKQYVPKDVIVIIGNYTGTMRSGLILQDIAVTNIPAFPPEASVRIQRLVARVPAFDPRDLSVDIFNARLVLPGCDPIVIEGQYTKGQVQARAYARVLDVHTLVSGVMQERFLKNLQGFITDAQMTVQGPLSGLRVTGTFFVDRIRYQDTTVSQGLGRVQAVLVLGGGKALLSGDLIMDSGLVNTRHRDIDLRPSRAFFTGGVLDDPSLDIHGTTQIEDIAIDFSIKGTLQKPELKLRSDPPMAEDMLWLVLAAGRTWTPSSLKYNEQTKALGVQKNVTDEFKLGLKFEETPVRPGQPATEYSRTVEGAVLLTDRFSINIAEKLLPQDRSGIPAQSDPTNTDPRRQTESQIYLKYKNTF
ncbi:MAG: translocation/assembly module TamB domain-containing protein [Candidatus Omnitrophota bacterium]|nr:translocation/assembly module TamB domain-containing protein [Candidatus Omnitrophota bacterium]